jgi:hypothetical protein
MDYNPKYIKTDNGTSGKYKYDKKQEEISLKHSRQHGYSTV